MTGVVNSEEVITRFLFSSKSFRADGTLRHSEFMPPKNWRMSVYRTDNLSDEEVLAVGKTYVEPERGKPIIGRADLKAIEIYNCGLTINPTDDPHPLHANVEGWSKDTEKDRLTALKLAAEASNSVIQYT